MNKTFVEIGEVFPNTHSVVFLHAHCDDESFLSAGLLNELSERDCTVMFGAACQVKGEEKTKIRQEQTIEACSILGENSVLFMPYCEPKYNSHYTAPLKNQRIEDISKEFWAMILNNDIKLPLSLVSYDANGGYGNKDHEIIHLVGRKVKAMHRNEVLLSEITINRDKMSKWLKEASTRLAPSSLPQLSYWKDGFGLPEEEIDLVFQLTNRQLYLKYKALSCHKFYNTPESFPLSLKRDDFMKAFGWEYLHIPFK